MQAATPTRINFQVAAKKAAMTAQKPFLVATAAAPPTTKAARPYSATLSPAWNSV